MDEKIELVQAHRQRYGLNACLRAVGLSKGTWHYRRHRKSQAERDAALKAEIVSVIEAHPDYGERRIHAELVERTERPINHKRLRRVLKQYDLGLRRCLPKPSSSPVVETVAQAGAAADLVKGRSFKALEVFSTDFTELLYAGGQRKAHLMVLLCIESRWAGGWAVGARRCRQLALKSLDTLTGNLGDVGRDLQGVIVHHDKDSVYTSYAWLRRVLLEENGRLSYAEHGAKDNPWIESFWGRFKTENAEVLLACETLAEVVSVVEDRLVYYNEARRHSSLDYKRPMAVLLATLKGGNIAEES